ncbi:MAG: hypothetical protein HC896_01020, partial [Bacteroidales bacterium]|nr:hypothetical protein [Bacteroidales bacterium]
MYEHAAEQNNTAVSDSIQIILTPPADLVVSDMEVSDASAANGDQVTVEWVIDNYGGSETKSNWKDGVYLLKEGDVDFANAIKIAEHTHTTMLNIGDFAIVSKNITVPNNLKDNYYVYVKTDINNNINELSFEDNNISDSVAIHITYSDFTIALVEHVDTIGSGDSIQVTFYLQNIGTGVNNSEDVCVSVGVSNNSVYDETINEFATQCVSPQIAVNDCTMITIREPLPQGVYGIKKLLVTADYENNIYEGDIENNNTHVSQLAINLNRWVDLKVSSIANPDTIKAGNNLQVNYTIENIGNKDLSEAYFETKVYVLEEDKLGCGATCGTLLQTVTKEYTIAQEDSVMDSVLVAVPNVTSVGNHVFLIVVDVADNIFEHIGETNNTAYNPVYVDKIPVDLIIKNLTADTVVYSGQMVTVAWEVQNIGTAGTNATWWHDAVYLSTDTILSAGDILLVKPKHNGSLGSMQSYNASSSFQVPNGVEGNYYLLVATDVDYKTSDNDFSNNWGVVRDTVPGQNYNKPIITTVVLSASADLEVTQLASTGNAVSG